MRARETAQCERPVYTQILGKVWGLDRKCCLQGRLRRERETPLGGGSESGAGEASRVTMRGQGPGVRA